MNLPLGTLAAVLCHSQHAQLCAILSCNVAFAGGGLRGLSKSTPALCSRTLRMRGRLDGAWVATSALIGRCIALTARAKTPTPLVPPLTPPLIPACADWPITGVCKAAGWPYRVMHQQRDVPP